MSNKIWCYLMTKFFSVYLSGLDFLILLGISMKVKPLNSLCVKSHEVLHSFESLK